MRLSATIRVPELTVEVRNAHDVVTAMTAAVHPMLVGRTRSGTGADGKAFPAPKDGGSPLSRSRQLLNHIGVVIRPPKGASKIPVGVIRALGDRTDAAERNSRAKARQASLRKAAVESARWAEIRGETPGLGKTAKGRWKTGRIRAREGSTNAAVAAILSQPPKDLRSKNGGRAQYRIFEANEREEEAARAAAQRVLRVEMKATGKVQVIKL